MSTYKEEKSRLEELGEAHELATRAANEVKLFFARHPEVRNLLCNYDIVYQYFNNSLDEITANALEDSYLNHPKFRAQLACFPSETAEREALENRILELSRGGTSPDGLRGIKAGFRFQNLEQLRAKKDALETNARLRAKTPQELRAEIQAARPGPVLELPPEISKEQILHMWGPEQFRFWAKKLGSMEPITRRINQKD